MVKIAVMIYYLPKLFYAFFSSIEKLGFRHVIEFACRVQNAASFCRNFFVAESSNAVNEFFFTTCGKNRMCMRINKSRQDITVSRIDYFYISPVSYSWPIGHQAVVYNRVIFEGKVGIFENGELLHLLPSDNAWKIFTNLNQAFDILNKLFAHT